MFSRAAVSANTEAHASDEWVTHNVAYVSTSATKKVVIGPFLFPVGACLCCQKESTNAMAAAHTMAGNNKLNILFVII
jgi:hypothetical protein